MTPVELGKRLTEVIDAKGDPEVAHSLEDKLHVDVLAAIAAMTTDQTIKDLAELAVATRQIEFERWHA